VSEKGPHGSHLRRHGLDEPVDATRVGDADVERGERGDQPVAELVGDQPDHQRDDDDRRHPRAEGPGRAARLHSEQAVQWARHGRGD
jgi:hypothetical protein